MKTLVAYFSVQGTTAKVAKELAEHLNADLFEIKPLHPYTDGLMRALPQTGEKGKKLFVIPGMVPPAGKFPSGCVFAPRCPYATEACTAAKPPLSITEDGRKVRCFRYNKEGNHGEQYRSPDHAEHIKHGRAASK